MDKGAHFIRRLKPFTTSCERLALIKDRRALFRNVVPEHITRRYPCQA